MDVDLVRLENYLAAFRKAAEFHQLRNEPDLNSAFRMPGMLSEAATGTCRDFEAPLVPRWKKHWPI